MSGVVLPDGTEFPGTAQPEPTKQSPMRKWAWLFLLCVVVVVGYWWNSHQNESKQTFSKASIELELARSISDLEQKHNAVSDWGKDLSWQTVYSIDLQKALIRRDGRPILFAGAIVDIRQNQERFQLELEPIGPAVTLRVILDCHKDAINGILAHVPRDIPYLVVTQMQSVSKASFRVDAHAEGVATPDFDYEGHSLPYVETFAELELDAGDVFIGHGKCVDVRPYPATSTDSTIHDKLR